ncbi:adenosine receptor A1-like [Aplysia californica]|uniref:Adenosine receptor A1-like n=1 Tax=Aplysia californica TaxID=6500 RepID=A0ABM0JBF0_APLCA|nr:adenosine receptor A1-like [Aplysia californica]
MTSSSLAKFVPLISNEAWAIIQVVNFVLICGLGSLTGLVTNVINIVVFAKQGFHDSVNVSLMGLAVSDLGSLVTTFWLSICFNPLFINAGLPINVMEVMNATGGRPHICFARVTSFITAFITFERCLCISLPLKVKMIITPRRTKIIIIFIFILMFSYPPFYVGNRLAWVFDSSRNATILKLEYNEEITIVEPIAFFLYGVTFSTFSFVFVICCTIVLVVKLNTKTKWRQATAAKGASAPEGVGVKDKKVVKMVTFISSIFIVCFGPSSFLFAIMALEPRFRFNGAYTNVYMVVWSASFILETVNSSVNMFVYLTMSSKYRAVFMKTFLGREEK